MRNSSRAKIDESALINLVKRNPELYDPSHSEAANQKHIEFLWEDIADTLDAPIEYVKKTWKNLMRNYSKTSKRKSLRSTTNLNFLPVPLIEMSNENSCASSACSSPKGDGKRSTRSVSQLSTASQAERGANLASATASLSGQNDSRGSGNGSAQEDACSIVENQSAKGNVCRYKERSASLEDVVVRPRLSEPSFLLSREVLQGAVSAAPRRLSDTPGARNKKKNNVADPIRAFFESMAMTVSTFPQHIQATIKLQICNLVEETEYGLSIPKPC